MSTTPRFLAQVHSSKQAYTKVTLKNLLLLIPAMLLFQVSNAEDSPVALSSATVSVQPSEQGIEGTSSTSYTYEMAIKPSVIDPYSPIPPICFDFVDYVKKHNALETYRLTGTFFDPDNPDKTFSEPVYEKITHDQGNWDLLLSLRLQEMLIRHNTENVERMATQASRGEAVTYQPFGSYYRGDGEWSEYYQMSNPYTLSPQERIQGSEDYLIERLKGTAESYVKMDYQLYRTVVDYNNDGIDETLIITNGRMLEKACGDCYYNLFDHNYIVDQYNNLDHRFYNNGFYNQGRKRPFIDPPVLYHNRTWYFITLMSQEGIPNRVVIYEILPPAAGQLPPISLSLDLCNIYIE